eukprot:COSAG06_NODE_340_length_17187_cov_578.135475_6_plen_132_part_00
MEVRPTCLFVRFLLFARAPGKFSLNKVVVWTDHIDCTQKSNNIWHDGPESEHGNLRWATFAEQRSNQLRSIYHGIKTSFPHEAWLEGEAGVHRGTSPSGVPFCKWLKASSKPTSRYNTSGIRRRAERLRSY